MTLESTTVKAKYTGNGATKSFPVPFSYSEADTIILFHTDAKGKTVPITSNYTIAVNGSGNTTVIYPIFGDPIEKGVTLTIYRNTPRTQVVSLSDVGAFSPEVLENQGFDRTVMMVQELQEEVDRSIKVPITSDQTPDELLEDIFLKRDQAVQSAKEAKEALVATTNQAGIATEQAKISTDQAEIATTQASIATNQAGIATEQAKISTDQAEIATTQASIATNQAGIATEQAKISTDQAEIATTQARIATNQAGIATNQAGIATEQAKISTDQAEVATNQANIAIKAADKSINGAQDAINAAEKAVNAANNIEGFADATHAFHGITLDENMNLLWVKGEDRDVLNAKDFLYSAILPTEARFFFENGQIFVELPFTQ